MKLVRVAIFLTGISGLAMGGIMTLSSLRAGQEEATLRANETLKSAATQFVDQFFSIVDTTKSLAPNATAIPSYVSFRAIAKLNQGVPSEFESFTSTDQASNSQAQPDFGLQERVLNSIKADLSLTDLQISKIAMGTYPLTDGGSREAIYLLTPIYKTVNGQVDPNAIEKLNISLIDPSKAFAGLQKIHSTEDNAGYLISKKGKVLAHTLAAYVGTDLKRNEKLKETVDHLFVGAQTGSVGKYKNVDGVEEQVAFVRAGTSPFAFAVEQKANPTVLSSAWFSDQAASGAARKNFGILFIIIAVALAGFAGASILTSRLVKDQIQASANARVQAANGTAPEPLLNEELASKIAPTLLTPRKSRPKKEAVPEAPAGMLETADLDARVKPEVRIQVSSFNIPASVETGIDHATDRATDRAVDKSAEQFVQVRDQKALEQEQLKAAVQGLSAPKDMLRDFLSKIEKAYTIEAVEKELVQVTAEVADSPILYFRYHRRNQSLTLSSVAGEVKIPNYTHMQAYVRKDIELQVEHMADAGKVASISNYGPMNKLINMHLNVAHFEAWGVTSEPSVSGQSRLVGVLVVLHAGMQSAQARPMLAKMLKGAGNYLYAQSNKIRPRSAQYQPSEINPISSMDDTNLS